MIRRKEVKYNMKIEEPLEELDGDNIQQSSQQVPFEHIIETMLDENIPLPTLYLYRLSDISDKDLEFLQQHWHKIPLWRRRALMEDLQMFARRDLLLSYEGIGRLALKDPDPKVRIGAIETLMANECECLDLIDIYLERMEKDEDLSVRIAAASALGQFVYLAEMEALKPEIKADLENRLLNVAQNGNDTELRLRALESLGYSSRDEVPSLIESAFNTPDPNFQTSSLIAMGRSGNERWNAQVVSMLNHSNPSIRSEAARAAGELGIVEARSLLFDLAEDANQNVCMSALWALSQIGGKGVRKLLQERLQEADDEEEISLLESALDNLDFNEGTHDMALLGDEEEDNDELFDDNLDDDIDEDIFDFDEDEDDFLDDLDDEDFDDFLDEEDEDYDFLDEEDEDDLWG